MIPHLVSRITITAGDQQVVIVEVGEGLRSYYMGDRELVDGYRADEMSSSGRGLFAVAIRHGLTTKDLNATMFAYPTGASDIGYML